MRFWNPIWETMPRKKLDEIHLKRIKKLIRYAYTHTQLYRRKFRECGLTPDDINTMDDFVKKVPFTTKEDLTYSQSPEQMFAVDALAEKSDTIIHYFQTSGTTGLPLKIPFSHYDTIKYGEDWVYGFWAVGIRPRFRFYFAFSWGMYAGFWSCYWGVRRLGCTAISGGGVGTEDRIKQLQSLKPDVLVATPTYAVYIAEMCRKMGVDPKSFGLKFFYGAGEPGPTAIPKLREELESYYGVKAYELYGVAEVGAIAPACPLQLGTHLNESNYHCIVIDPETGELLSEGERGENVVTSFAQLSQPVIKYRTKDIVEWHYSDACECGRTWVLYKGSVLARSDYVVKVRGVNIYQTAIENIIRSIPGASPYIEMHLRLDERKLDDMLIKVEADQSLPSEMYSDLENKIAEAIRGVIGVRLAVEVLPPNSLPRYELKAKKIFDHRPKERRMLLER